ncbi:MAG: hypothetical protein P4L33_04350 [Capsulimonadaceae bacterium]|nr:hypothetical protein [Capsulimonadaceae bacterium]
MATTTNSTKPSDPSSGPRGSKQPNISVWRAILLGTLLVPINAFWVTVAEVRWYNLDGTSLPLFVTPVFMLFMLVLANMGLGKILRRKQAPLRQEELLVVYIMLVTSCAFAGHDTLQNLFGVIAHPYWFANPTNHWQQLFFGYLPRQLFVSDNDALTAFYAGGVDIYGPDGRKYLISWIVPLALWGAFFLVLVGVYLCITVLIRHAWIENEKLTFPIVQLPMAMTAEDAPKSFFGNRVMWAGFLVAAIISTLNGLHELSPGLPQLNVKLFELSTYFTSPPWNAIGSTQSSFYPFMIGLAYFMPLDLSLSCWVFYIFARAFRIIGAANGYMQSGHQFPYFGEQSTGAWIGIALMLLFSGRHYFKSIFTTAAQGAKSSEPAEAFRYRCAIAGLVAGMGALWIFTSLLGMSAWVTFGFFAIVFMLGFVVTRVRAEFGCPHEIVWCNPCQVLVGVFGTHALGPQNLTLLSVLYWFNRGYRNHPMPNQLEAFKMLEKKRVTFSGTIGVLALAAVVSLLSVYWANLHVTYAAGAAAKAMGYKVWVGRESFDRLRGWLTVTTPPASTALYYMAGGFAFAVLLLVMRSNLEWWPLHPTGYALALSFAMEYFWLPVFIAWLVKFTVLRYGGVKLYRATLPFFLGLILGDYTVGALWSLIGCLAGIPTYRIYI